MTSSCKSCESNGAIALVCEESEKNQRREVKPTAFMFRSVTCITWFEIRDPSQDCNFVRRAILLRDLKIVFATDTTKILYVVPSVSAKVGDIVKVTSDQVFNCQENRNACT